MLTLTVNVGQSVAIGGPTNVRVAKKSGQEVQLVFDADRSVPIRIIDAPTPQGTSYGLSGNRKPAGAGLGLTKESSAAE